MIKVLLKYEPLKRYGALYVNDEPVSEYGDLSLCATKDLHVFGARLFKLLDAEYQAQYEFHLRADPFIIDMMRGLSEQSEYCAGVTGEPVRGAFPFQETLSFFMDLAERCRLDLSRDFSVYASGDAVGRVSPGLVTPNESLSALTITEAPLNEQDRDALKEQVDALPRGVSVVLSDHYAIYNQGPKNVVVIPAARLDDFCRYYQLYTKQIPFIEAVVQASRHASLNETDAAYLDAYASQRARYLFRLDAQQLDVGMSAPFTFMVIPPSAAGAYVLKENAPGLLRFRDGAVDALNPGTVTVAVMDRAGNIEREQTITVVKRSYVTSIKLVTRTPRVEVMDKIRVDAYLTPADAEDAAELKWSGSDPDIIHVTPDGEITALKAGRAWVTAACRNCRESVEIQVLPPLERVSINPPELKVEIGKSAVLQCVLTPPDASHGPIAWELSNPGMGTLAVSEDGMKCQYTSVKSALNRGTLTCKVQGSDKAASCPVQNFIRVDDRPIGLMTCAIIFTVLGCLFGFTIPVMWLLHAGIWGYFFDFCLPVSLVLCLIGQSKTDNREKTFNICLAVNLAWTVLMFLIALALSGLF